MRLEESSYYIKGVLDQDRLIIAKTITLIESSLKKHQELSGIILKKLSPHTGNAIRIGITGVPGVGKSTFIENFGLYLIDKSLKVAVLPIDPSSSKTGGSVMADKNRMELLSTRENAYIRPSPSGTCLGGVSIKTRETMLICEAAGYDVIIVETVGVGQSETTVHQMVDFFLVLMLAGAGDEYQGIKKGIIEMADTLAINKADGDNIQKAITAKRQYENALHLLRPSSPSWTPKVLTISGLNKTGINELWEIITDHRAKTMNCGEFEQRRRKQAVNWMWTMLEEGLKLKFFENQRVKSILPKILQEVEKGDMQPTLAASSLLDLLKV